MVISDIVVGLHNHSSPGRRGVRSREEVRREGLREERRGMREGVRRMRDRGVEGAVEGARVEVHLGRRRGDDMRYWKRTVITWNERRLSVRETNRRRLRRVAERVKRERWEMVLLTELSAKVWLGEDEEMLELSHGRKACVILRGVVLKEWVEEGQQIWLGLRERCRW